MARHMMRAAAVLVSAAIGMAMTPALQAAEVMPIGIVQLVEHDALDAANRGIVDGMAERGFKDGVNVNVICPLAWTAQLEKFEKAYPDAFKANVKMPPMGHFGDVEKEIGRVCVQLASPDFKYMSGETITLEGGMGLRP